MVNPNLPEILTRVPYFVEQASYCVSYHDRNLCPECTDTGCVRLDEAATVLAEYRAQRSARYRLTAT
ncbi:hypothetical protein OG994_16595 [Micromonospora globbae]|uniref:Uncharacterized protein n=1 Tax=Micromonospora globbae TaxID=1894969 RepID=A0ABZ1S011_9ACTN|nr:hypothetical protein [Micromonospora globbae]